jgi:Peptidase S24-like
MELKSEIMDVAQHEFIAQRLRELVQVNGGNKRVAEASGIPLSTLNTYLAGTEPKISVAAKLAEFFCVPMSSLLSSGTTIQDHGFSAGGVQIPLRDVYVSSGPGAEALDEAILRYLSFDPFFVESWGVSPDKVEAVINRGDSNEPTIRDGAIVLIDRSDRKLREKPIFAFRTPDGVRLKRFQRLIDGSARLVSDNHAFYAPELVRPVDLEQLKIIGRAFWTGMEL